MKKQKGFTLIELLVVIAIIGILSSVVLASLNTARNKGSDAAIKADLNNIRAQAELVYDSTSSYAGVCTNTNVVQGIAAAATSSGTTWTSTANNLAGLYCGSATSTWIAEMPLKSGGYWCVDNTGQAKYEGTGSATSVTQCP